MNKKWLAMAVILLGVGSGCSGVDQRYTMPVVDGSTGIEVHATIGPVCPVESPGQNCDDKPYEAELIVDARSSGEEIGRIRTDENGRTGLTGMEPGEYTIRPAMADGPPTAAPVDFTVRKGEITQVTIRFDSGIR